MGLHKEIVLLGSAYAACVSIAGNDVIIPFVSFTALMHAFNLIFIL